MKTELGWRWPDGEKHLIEWMQNPKNRVVLNGRFAYQGKKQQAALEAVDRFKRARRVAVDVGAHVGLWSFNLAAAFDTVHAFEPVATMRECFARNLAELRNVTMHPVALGAVEGSVSIATDPHSTGDSRVSGQGDIPMVTLDSFALTEVDLVKIDCEGYEENVLRGAFAIISAWSPVVIVEQKRDMATRFGLQPLGAVTLLRSMGYDCYQEIGGDHIMVRG